MELAVNHNFTTADGFTGVSCLKNPFQCLILSNLILKYYTLWNFSSESQFFTTAEGFTEVSCLKKCFPMFNTLNNLQNISTL